MTASSKKPVVLIVLDGFGVSFEKKANAIALAKTPHFDEISSNYPGALLQASGAEVGLRWGEMGNSEVGHGNLGAGQVVYQNLSLIDLAIQDKTFDKQPLWKTIAAHTKKTQGKMHIMGLLSNGGIHAHIDHFVVTVRALRVNGFSGHIYFHVVTDGQDTAPQSAQKFYEILSGHLEDDHDWSVATVIGRYYAMDKNENWDRTAESYTCLTKGGGVTAPNFDTAIAQAYKKGVSDEMLPPTTILNEEGKPQALIEAHDTVLYMNFRADRARQLTKAFVDPDFDAFSRKILPDLLFVSMADYGIKPPIPSIFKGKKPKYPLASILARHHKKQFHIAETEKYAHVTYFFNGGVEELFPGEERMVVPSPKVASYDKKPAMSAQKITQAVLERLQKGGDDFILINYANGDMVGHTGNLAAAIEAVEVLDRCVGKVVAATLKRGGTIIITADHGNVEEMLNSETGVIDKEHSTNPVPLWLITPDNRLDYSVPMLTDITPQGMLADVAPTILGIMGLEQPETMTGLDLRKVITTCRLPKK